VTQSEIIDLTPNVEKFPLGANAHVVDFKPTSPAIMISALRSDGSYYPIEKVEAHAKGIHHLAVSVFVWSKGALLIQKRAAHKFPSKI